jgi:NAD(P)-dependent dehydrogenase (short-subunit alcohol dehydrogenase family)
MVDLKDKVVLVTGANRGIGKAFVEAFLAHGASKVYAAVRDVDSVGPAFDADLLSSGRVVPILMDLGRPETVFEAAASLATDVDVVVNNAGILSRTSPLDVDAVDRLMEEMTVNVYGLMHVARAFAPILEGRQGGGVLVQVNSVASLRCGVADVSTYSASKAAAFSLTQALRQQLASRKVTVVSVHPGPIATDMLSDLPELARVAEPPRNVAEAVIQALEGEGPVPFLVFPDEKARQLGLAYQDYAKRVIEDGHMYG